MNFDKRLEMPKKAVILLILLPAFVPSFAQDESEIARFETLLTGTGQASIEELLPAATMRLEQAREIGDSRKEARAMKELGLIHLAGLHDCEKAMDFLIRSLAIEDSLAMDSEKLLTLVAIAKVFEIVGDYYKSAQFLQQALGLNQDNRDINSVALILNNLGNVNAAAGKIEEAFANYKRVLSYRDDIDKRFEAEALYNLGQLYTLQGDYPRALDNHKRALAITRSEKDRYREARSLDDIGEVYELMDNDDKSLANHLVALDIRRQLQDKTGLAESYNHIARFYQRKNDSERAIANGLLALENGREAQAQEEIFKSYELLSQSYKEKADFRNALSYKELSLAIREFIQNEKQERQVLETQNRYVLGKKEAEIENLEAVRVDRERELAAHKKFSTILFLLVVLGFIIATLIFVLYLVKRRSNRILSVARDEVQRQNVKLQELNQTKDKFFSIISHDLKGPLNSLTSFSHLLIEHTENLSKEEIQMLARDLDKSVRNLFALLENLLEWSRAQTGAIDFTPEEFDLGELLDANRNLLESQASNKNIDIILEPLPECRVRLHKQSINTVVRNLISNAIKFSRENGIIRIGIGVSTEGVEVSVSDNGVGMTPEVIAKLFRLDQKHSTKGTANEKGTGLGLILCREFIEKNGGTIRVESELEKGSSFIFSFPRHVLGSPEKRIAESAAP